MSSATDFLEKTLGLTQSEVSAISSIGTIISTVESVVGGVQTAINLINSVWNLITGTSQPSALDVAMKQLLNAFQDLLAASDEQIAMLAIATYTGQAETGLTALNEWIGNNPSADPTATGDPAWVDQRNSILNNTLTAATTLGQEAFWQRPYDPDLVYSDSWIGNRTPPTGSDPNTSPSAGAFVFDYRLALPAYLEVVSIRLAILVTTQGKLGSGTQQEIASYVNQLIAYYTQIRAGLIEHPAPTYPDLLAHYTNPPQGQSPQLLPSNWASRGTAQLRNVFGVVDVYSTFNLISGWPDSTPNTGLVPQSTDNTNYPPFDYPKFLVRHLVRTMNLWKKAYVAIGLAQAATLIAQLNQLAGSPAPALDGPTGDWSLRELGQRLSKIAGSGFTFAATGTPLISARSVLSALQTNVLQPHPSLRAALAQ